MKSASKWDIRLEDKISGMGGTTKRGYYLYATPQERKTNTMPDGSSYETISTRPGVGLRLFLKEVPRKSKKAEQEAEAIANKEESWLVEQVCERYGLELADAV